MKRRLNQLSGIFALVIATQAAFTATILVDDNAPNDPGPGNPGVSDPLEDGTAAHPFDAIQEGIDAAVNGDEVVLADGTYSGTGNVNLNFNGKLITVRSASGIPAQCIIDGQNVNPGFTFNNGETNAAVVDGLTITQCAKFAPSQGGAAFLIQVAGPTINNCILSNNFADTQGGAIKISTTNLTRPIITNCVFTNNQSNTGGGAVQFASGAGTLTSCTFTGNFAASFGGGVSIQGGSPVLNNCTFNFNFTLTGAGGGMAITGGTPNITSCVFDQNTAQTRGGAIYIANTGRPTIADCTITNNVALTEVGGGVAITTLGELDNTINNCFIESNSAALAGGGLDYDPVVVEIGNSLTVSNTTFAGNFTLPDLLGVGGGISNTSATLDLQNCIFDTNTASLDGGGIHTAGGIVSLTSCVLGGNSAGLHGGGIASELDNLRQGAALTLTDCQLIANQAIGGGGIYSNLGTVSVTNCAFNGNSTNFNGGGAMRSINSTMMVTNCTFSGNSAGGLNGGGAIRSTNSTQMVTNCTFSGNTAMIAGGALNIPSGESTVTNCTFSGNTALDGGAIWSNSGTSTVTNCNLWGNSPDEIFFITRPVVTYCNIQGGFTGTGNINVDPLFINVPGGNLRLLAGSPCFDAGDNTAPALATILTDLDGNNRLFDDPATADTGNGVAPIVDMGAYEFGAGPPPPPCPADCALPNDGVVNVTDLLNVLADWGGPGSCDVDGNGVTDVTDLLTLLGAWGACP